MKYALLFPGQGSQEVGMLRGLAESHPEIDDTFREASAILGWDVLALVKDGPAAELNRTQRTQPALLASSIAVLRAWRSLGVPEPDALAGHSLGEYSALVAAGALDFADGLRLVELRGLLMQAAVPEGSGAMAAVIGLDDDAVEAACRSYTGEGVLEPANYNAPGQVVVAGTREAIDWLVANGKAVGARKIMPIPVSVPSHCSLMRGAADALADRLASVTFKAPRIPVLHNLDAAPRSSPEAIRTALIEQLYRPVRWARTVQDLRAQGIGALLECGPGKVLANLNKRIVDIGPEGLQSASLGEPDGLQHARALWHPQTA